MAAFFDFIGGAGLVPVGDGGVRIADHAHILRTAPDDKARWLVDRVNYRVDPILLGRRYFLFFFLALYQAHRQNQAEDSENR